MIRYLALASLFLVGCASVNVHKSPSFSFDSVNKIGVTAFTSSDVGMGQIVADQAGFEFTKKGYAVIDRGQIQSLISEQSLNMTGITDEQSAQLSIIGVSEILVGSLSAPPCATVMQPVENTSIPSQQCSASISMKLIRVANGETLWQANASHSRGGINYSQAKLTQLLIEKISEQIPRK